MKIFLRDYRAANGDNIWLDIFRAIPGFREEDQHMYTPNIQPEAISPELASPDCLLFLHTTDAIATVWIDQFKNRKCEGSLIRISTDGIHSPEVAPAYACWWQPGDFEKVPQAIKFRKNLEKGRFFPELLWPQGVPPTLLAYALADHYRLCGDSVTKWQSQAKEEFTTSQPRHDAWTPLIDMNSTNMKKLIAELSRRK